MKIIRSITASLCVALALGTTVMAQDVKPTQDVKPKESVLITNANVFDGTNEKLAGGMSVLIEGNRIAKIAKSIPAPTGATVIDAKGKVLMPGLTDAHWHVMFANPTMPVLLTADIGYLTLLAAKGAGETLMRGFTAVRDVGGNPFAVKKAIDGGVIPGPRIYPSGPMISQTSGHADSPGAQRT